MSKRSLVAFLKPLLVSGLLSLTFGFSTVFASDPVLVPPHSPYDGEIDVSPIDNIVVKFDQNIFFDSGTAGAVEIRYMTDSTVAHTYTQSSQSSTGAFVLSISGDTLTIDPHVPLASLTDYYITISSNWIKNSADEYYAGLTDGGGPATGIYPYNFRTEYVPDTATVTFSPEDNALDVDESTNLVVTFNQNIENTGVGEVRLYKDTSTLVQTFLHSDPNLVVNQDTLTLTPSALLDTNTSYHVQIDNGLIRSVLTHDPYDGINNSTTWNFDTSTLFSPADNSTGVDPRTNLTITFADNISFPSSGNQYFRIRRTSNNAVVESYTRNSSQVSISGNTLTIDPNINLEGLTQYYIEITPGLVYKSSTSTSYPGISDTYQGNSTTYRWNFTTGNSVAPSLVSLSPPDDSTGAGVAADLIVTFDEYVKRVPYDPGLGHIEIRKTSDNSLFESLDLYESNGDPNPDISFSGYEMHINPDSLMAPFTHYYVIVNSGIVFSNQTYETQTPLSFAGITGTWNSGDTENNSNYEWNFTTGNAVSPVVVQFIPADNSTNKDIDTDLTIQFDQDMKIFDPTDTGDPDHGTATAGTLKIVKMIDDTVVETYDYNDMTISVDLRTISIDRTTNLDHDTDYYILIEDEIIRSNDTGIYYNIAGENFPGIVNDYTWNFNTVEDFPYAISYSPLHNANHDDIDASVTTNMTITFNQSLKTSQSYQNIVNNKVRIREHDTGVIVAQTGFSSLYEKMTFTLSGSTLTLDPEINLKTNTHYYIEIDPDALYANSSNLPFAGITDPNTWHFDTGSTAVAPTCTPYDPADDSLDNPVDANLVLECDEPIENACDAVDQSTCTGTFELWESVSGGADVLTATYRPDNSLNPLGTLSFKNGGSGNDDYKIAVNPNFNLKGNTNYYIKISNDLIQSQYSETPYDGIADDFTWNFNTDAAPPPNDIALFPANNSLDNPIETDFHVTFDETIQLGSTGSLVVYKDSSSNTIVHTYTPADLGTTLSITDNTLYITSKGDLEPNKRYHINISNDFIQSTGTLEYFTGFSGISAWHFYTQTTPPVVLTFDPPDDTADPDGSVNGVDTTTDMIITFDRSIRKICGTGKKVYIRDYADDSIVQEYDITSGHLHVTSNYNGTQPGYDNESRCYGALTSLTKYEGFGLQFIISPTEDNDGFYTDAVGHVLPPNTHLYIQMAGDILQSSHAQNNNLADREYFAGLLNKEDWDFWTGDAIAPTLLEFTPADGSTDVETTTNFTMRFSEPVVAGAANGGGNPGRFRVLKGDNTVVAEYDLSDITFTPGSSEITITSTQSLDYNESFYIQIDSGLIKGGTSGLDYAGISDTNIASATWNFATKEAPPILTTLVPADDQTGYGDNFIVMNFDKDVRYINSSDVINIRRVSDNSLYATNDNYDVANGIYRLSISSTLNTSQITATLHNNTQFESNTAYYVTAEPGFAREYPGSFNYFCPQAAGCPSTCPSLDVCAGAGIADGDTTTWNFTTGSIAPFHTTFSPPDNATDVDVDDDYAFPNSNDGSDEFKLRMDFSETISFDTGGDFSIYYDCSGNGYGGYGSAPAACGSGTTPVLLYSYQNGDLELSIEGGDQLVVNPRYGIPGNVSLFVNVSNNLIQSAATSVFYNGITTETLWNFSTENHSPVLINLTPPDESVDVSVLSVFEAIFDQDMEFPDANNPAHAGSNFAGTVTFRKYSDDSIIASYDKDSPAVGLFGDRLTVDPDLALPSEHIYVTIDGNWLRRVNGFYDSNNTNETEAEYNHFAGFSDKETWDVEIEILTVPVITDSDPEDDAHSVPLGNNITITFDQNIVHNSTGSLSLYKTDGDVLVETFTHNDLTWNATNIVANPINDLEVDIDYYVTISNDLIYNMNYSEVFPGISDNTTLNFTTKVPTPVLATNFVPQGDTTDPALSDPLSISFNQNIQLDTGTLSLYTLGGTLVESFDQNSSGLTINNDTLVINPSNDLDYNQTYYLEISNQLIQSAYFANFHYAGITDDTTWRFKIVDPIPVLATSFSPLDGATDIAIATDLSITFNQNIQLDTGTLSLYSSGGTLVESFDQNSGALSINTSTLTINPSSSLDFNTTYYVQISTQLIQSIDFPTFYYAGIADTATWDFTTIARPNITAFDPPDVTPNAPLNTDLTITFDKDIIKGTGTLVIYNESDDSVFESINITDAIITVSSNTATIDPVTDWVAGASYYVTLSAGAFTDSGGNAYLFGIKNTIEAPDDWNFTMYTPPASYDISGTVYLDQGITPMGADRTVMAALNGTDTGITAQTDANGNFTLNNVIYEAEDRLTIYLEDESENAMVITVAPNADITGLDLYEDHVILRHDSGGVLDVSDLAAADIPGDNDVTGANGFYTFTYLGPSQYSLVSNTGRTIFIPSGQSIDFDGLQATFYDFEIRGSYTHSSNSALNIDNNYTQKSGTFTMGTSNNINLDGDFTLSGGTFTTTSGTLNIGGDFDTRGIGTFNHNDGTINLNGSGDQTVSGTNTFYNLTTSGNAVRSIYMQKGTHQTIDTNGSLDFSGSLSNTITVRPTDNDSEVWYIDFKANTTEHLEHTKLIQQKFTIVP